MWSTVEPNPLQKSTRIRPTHIFGFFLNLVTALTCMKMYENVRKCLHIRRIIARDMVVETEHTFFNSMQKPKWKSTSRGREFKATTKKEIDTNTHIEWEHVISNAKSKRKHARTCIHLCKYKSYYFSEFVANWKLKGSILKGLTIDRCDNEGNGYCFSRMITFVCMQCIYLTFSLKPDANAPNRSFANAYATRNILASLSICKYHFHKRNWIRFR